MGNSPTANTPSNQFQHFLLRKSEEIVSLGKFDTYEDRNSGSFYLAFESTYGINNQELAESEISQLRKLDALKNSCRLLSSSVGKSQLLCFENYAITLSFEYYPNNLLTLSKSKGPDHQFAEQDLWQLITDIVTYLVSLNSFGLSHGDLQPKNILFDKNKSLKIICPLIYTVFQNAYKLRLANDGFKSTYSPEMLLDYADRNPSPSYDPVRSDIFSLGICLLCYIHSIDYEVFYNFKANSILFDKIKSSLSLIIQMQYSEELFFFVNLCLKQNTYERATLDYLMKIISKRQAPKGEGIQRR